MARVYTNNEDFVSTMFLLEREANPFDAAEGSPMRTFAESLSKYAILLVLAEHNWPLMERKTTLLVGDMEDSTCGCWKRYILSELALNTLVVAGDPNSDVASTSLDVEVYDVWDTDTGDRLEWRVNREGSYYLEIKEGNAVSVCVHFREDLYVLQEDKNLIDRMPKFLMPLLCLRTRMEIARHKDKLKDYQLLKSEYQDMLERTIHQSARHQSHTTNRKDTGIPSTPVARNY